MNVAAKLVNAIKDLTAHVGAIEVEAGAYPSDLLLKLVHIEAEVIGLHGMVANRYAKLPLEVAPVSDSCTQTGIRFKETGDTVKFEVPRVWHLRMQALRSGAQAIADALITANDKTCIIDSGLPPEALAIADAPEDEHVRPPTKPNRSKYEPFFNLMDELLAQGMTVREATMKVMQGNVKTAQSFERMWQRRNRRIRETNRGDKPT